MFPELNARLEELAASGQVLEGTYATPMAVFEDTSEDYGEQRWIGIGLLNLLVVLIVHVEQDGTIHIISMRKADRDETNLFYQTFV